MFGPIVFYLRRSIGDGEPNHHDLSLTGRWVLGGRGATRWCRVVGNKHRPVAWVPHRDRGVMPGPSPRPGSMRAFSGDVLFQTTAEIRKKVKELFQNKVRG
jgi:hypothetical protein